MRTIRHTIAAITLIATLAACGTAAPSIDDEDFAGTGTVVDRDTDPQHCTGKGKKRQCDDKDWLLKVKKTDGKTVWVDVDEAVYNAHPKGRTFSR